MRFFSIFALILFGLLSPAFAACDEEVRDALGKFWQSGPFYYVSQKWNINFMRQMAGKIAPGNIEHRTLQVYDGIEAGEEILIGNKSWRDDGLGWMGPHFASWSHDVGIPKDFQFFQFIENASCAGDVEIAGSIYRKFNYKPGSFSKLSTAKEEKHTIYVDPANGLIARYERTSKNESFIKMVSTFRFDNSIRIKPPAVDLQGRKEKSIRVFNEVVEKSDPNCRNSVSDIINTAQNHYPFEYEIIGSLWSGVSRISGKFVPPYSISYYIHGVPYHGGDSEIVLINKAGWSRRKGEDWSELANGLRDYNNSAPVGRTLPHLLIGKKIHIGSANCENSGTPSSDGLIPYTYNLYVDGEKGRMRARNMRMYVNPENSLPIKFEALGNKGQVVRLETRLYNSSLTIKPPSISYKTHRLEEIQKLDELDKLNEPLIELMPKSN